jgi:hypothetical protein
LASGTAPVKTPEGLAELGTRRLRLSQRHRTVLLLVDGKRSEAEVRRLAALAGVPATCFDELLALSLIAVPESGRSRSRPTSVDGGAAPGAPAGAVALASTAVAPASNALAGYDASAPPDTAAPPIPGEPAAPFPAEAPAQAVAAPEPVATGPVPIPIAVEDSLLPAARTLPPDSGGADSVLGGKPPPDSWLPPESEDEEGDTPLDAVVAQARDMLVRAVKSEAPLAGTLTVLRLRRARDRDELLELLDEVETRLGRRQLSLAANQTLQSVRRLLERGEDGARSAA